MGANAGRAAARTHPVPAVETNLMNVALILPCTIHVTTKHSKRPSAKRERTLAMRLNPRKSAGPMTESHVLFNG